MGGETYPRDKETERETRQRGFWERDRCGKASEIASRVGEGESARPREAWRNVRLGGVPTPISRVSLTPSQLCWPVLPPPPGPGPHLGVRQPFRVAGDGWCWPRLACRRQLGNIWEFCRPVVGRLKLVLVGALTPQKVGKPYKSGLCLVGWCESQFTTSMPLPGVPCSPRF